MKDNRTSEEIEASIRRVLEPVILPIRSPEIEDAVEEFAHALTFDSRRCTSGEHKPAKGKKQASG